ncbi:MAG: 16S rRNA (cytosine(1402)-N(4))-methyltransferase RsmH [Candidatus Dormibacter sp.]|uniref:16S rRNA (cytosine(1402)-N(4))-methyltransferase RsmH n=1 Tax=Candidatus Dormibacter sp. TaxID=2973982 RepID=UPI000DB53B78|nr:MAG: 16S rRNA (cytosine(1402)-N(4))-methyltransferase [Candidatus Dormibacteraeota bacterium]
MHIAVLSQASIRLLQPLPGAVFVDCTFGAGGHSRRLLEQIQPGGRLLALDQDERAVQAARQLAEQWPGAVTAVHGNFADLVQLAGEHGFTAVAGILFDLGFSSDQLEDPQRGFSFLHEGPLDMRMNRTQQLTAAQVVNELPARELAHLIRSLGEERWAARIAEFIAARRPLTTTLDLAEAVKAAMPRGAWPKGTHPATRTFQAIRMHVNDELGSLRRGLAGATQILNPGGRMAAISFHSLEDAEVKRFFIAESKDCLCPPQQPVCTCAHRATLRILTRKPLRPDEAEVTNNPRSRSARLRAAERL